jgi:hypothetical protein
LIFSHKSRPIINCRPQSKGKRFSGTEFSCFFSLAESWQEKSGYLFLFFDGLATLSSLVELCLVGDGHLPLGVGREIVSQSAVRRYFFDSITKNGSQSVIFRQHNNRLLCLLSACVVEWTKQQEKTELWANFGRNYVQKHKASSAASLQRAS